MGTGALGFGGMQAGLCQPRRDGKQEGWGTPKKKPFTTSSLKIRAAAAGIKVVMAGREEGGS